MKKGFTLIELLIVVAIIAILAAIAVPNFLEAQTRAKVSRCKSDMRSIATALESYMVDYNMYPYDGAGSAPTAAGQQFSYWHVPHIITTPVAYMTKKDFDDPFRSKKAGTVQYRNLRYTNVDSTWDCTGKYKGYNTNSGNGSQLYHDMYESQLGKWRLTSCGPDTILSNGSQVANYNPAVWPFVYNGTVQTLYEMNMPYDATNGTISYGDIIRTARGEGYANAK